MRKRGWGRAAQGRGLGPKVAELGGAWVLMQSDLGDLVREGSQVHPHLQG